MKTNRALLRRLVVSVIAITSAFTPNASAQTKATADERITLPDFTVVSERKDDAYAATHSMTGSRVSVAIRDLPYQVNVVTSEFLDDFGFLEFNNSAGALSSVVGVDNQGNNYIRGFQAPRMLRNGFFRIGLFDRVNIDRIEVIKGPAAAIYGESSPGGMMNIITKQPRATAEESLRLTFGDFSTFRAELNATGPLGSGVRGQTLYQLSAATYSTEYQVPLVETRSHTASGVLSHRFSPATRVSFEFEWMDRETVQPMVVPYLIDPTKGANAVGRFVGLAPALYAFNTRGPQSFITRSVINSTLVGEHSFNPVYSLRVAANLWNRPIDQLNPSGDVRNYDPVRRAIVQRNAYLQHNEENGYAFQVDLAGRFKTADFEHRPLLTADFSLYDRNEWRYRLPPAVANDATRFTSTLLIDNPVFLVPTDRSLYTVPEAAVFRDNAVRNYGFSLRHQVSGWKDRLVAVAALRYDITDYTLANPVSALNLRYDLNAWSPQIGLNYKWSPQILTFANASKSVNSQAQNRFATGPALPFEGAVGYEAGMRVSLLEDRFTATLAVFDVTRDNVLFNVIEINPATGVEISVPRPVGTYRVSGFEAEGNLRLRAGLQLIGTYGFNDGRFTETGVDIDLKGRGLNVPRHSLSAALVQRFSTGTLKGLTLRAAATYGSSRPTSIGGGVDTNNDRLLDANTGIRDIRYPSAILWTLGAGYAWKNTRSDGRRHFGHSVQVNLKNAFDATNIRIDGALDDPRRLEFSYQITR
jgi:outer membrane receptor protein involved in Fe transport